MQQVSANARTRDQASADEVFESLLNERFSCRSYLEREVPRDVIERILHIARRTASWCNSQPWQVLLTRGEATERFRKGMVEYVASHPADPDFEFPAKYAGVYLDRRRECGLQLYEAVGIARGDREASQRQAMKNFELFGAPHLAIITTEADLGVYGAVDCGAYVSNFLLAARSCGVDSIPQAALAGYSPFIRQFFDIPEHRRVVCGISFGYGNPEHPANRFRTTRAKVEDTTLWFES